MFCLNEHKLGAERPDHADRWVKVLGSDFSGSRFDWLWFTSQNLTGALNQACKHISSLRSAKNVQRNKWCWHLIIAAIAALCKYSRWTSMGVFLTWTSKIGKSLLAPKKWQLFSDSAIFILVWKDTQYKAASQHNVAELTKHSDQIPEATESIPGCCFLHPKLEWRLETRLQTDVFLQKREKLSRSKSFWHVSTDVINSAIQISWHVIIAVALQSMTLISATQPLGTQQTMLKPTCARTRNMHAKRTTATNQINAGVNYDGDLRAHLGIEGFRSWLSRSVMIRRNKVEGSA